MRRPFYSAWTSLMLLSFFGRHGCSVLSYLPITDVTAQNIPICQSKSTSCSTLAELDLFGRKATSAHWHWPRGWNKQINLQFKFEGDGGVLGQWEVGQAGRAWGQDLALGPGCSDLHHLSRWCRSDYPHWVYSGTPCTASGQSTNCLKYSQITAQAPACFSTK